MDDAMLSPILWYRRSEVRAAMRALNLTEVQLWQNAKAEADGLAVWCRWIPGVLSSLDAGGKLPRGTSNLRVDDISLAIAADFAVTIESE